MTKKKDNAPGLIRRIAGSPSSWLLPFHALRAAYEYTIAPIFFLPRLVVLVMKRSGRVSGEKHRIYFGAFSWPGPLGLIFCGLSIFYAASGYLIISAICLMALAVACFLRVDFNGRK